MKSVKNTIINQSANYRQSIPKKRFKIWVKTFVIATLLCIAQSSKAAPRSIDASSPQLPQVNAVQGVGNVEEGSGDYTYSYPIAVPPGRKGMEPSVALNYRSSGAIYGTVAHGWSLPIPVIKVDISSSQIGREENPVYTANGSRLVDVTYAETLPSGAVAAYRAEHDSNQTRYFRMNNTTVAYAWEIHHTDGSKTLYGKHQIYAQYDPESGISSYQPSPVDKVAPIYKRIDIFGNEIEYEIIWNEMDTGVYPDTGNANRTQRAVFYQLEAIHYGANRQAGLDHHAEVVFNYNESNIVPISKRFCEGFGPTIGSITSYRTGILMASGVNWLTSIETYADRDGDGDVRENEQVKRYNLRYNMNASKCDAAFAPRRQLWTIQEKSFSRGSQSVASKPPVSFEYGSLNAEWEETTLSLPHAINTVYDPYWRSPKFKEYQYVVSRLVDMDGDGLKDFLALDSQETRPLHDQDIRVPNCRAYWLKNFGGTFAPMEEARYVKLPTVKWGMSWGEDKVDGWCSLRSQYTGGFLLQYNWIDYDHDGDTDLLVQTQNVNGVRFEDDNDVAQGIDSQSIVSTDYMGENFPYTYFPKYGNGYIWHKYENHNGVLDEISKPMSQPVPLNAPTLSTSSVGFADVNSDGIRDILCQHSVDPEDSTEVKSLIAALGDGTGHYKKRIDFTEHITNDTTASLETTCIDVLNDQGEYVPQCIEYYKPRPLISGVFNGPSYPNHIFTDLYPSGGGYQTLPRIDNRRRTDYIKSFRIDINGDGLADMIKQKYTFTPAIQDHDFISYFMLNSGTGYERISSEDDWDDIETMGRRLLVQNPDNNDIYSLVHAANLQQFEAPGFNDRLYLGLGRGYFQSGLIDFDGDGLLDKFYIDYDDRWSKTSAPTNQYGNATYPEDSYELLRNAPNSPADRFTISLNYMGLGFLPAKSISSKELAAAMSRVRDIRRHSTFYYSSNDEFLALFDDESIMYRYENVGVVEDIDGDGYQDYLTVSFDAPQTYKVQKRVYDTPPGLLKRVVHSGGFYHPYDASRRGGYTNIRYASIHDQSVVISDTENGKAPRTGRFVVESVSNNSGTYPGNVLPKMEETFRYINPVFNRDEIGKMGFRGFEKVQQVKVVYPQLEGWTRIQETVRDFSDYFGGKVVKSTVKNDRGDTLFN